MLAGLVRRGEDFDAAEDALQEALLEALRVWPEHPPRDPGAWLATVATRRIVDARRSEAARVRREEVVHAEPPPGPTEEGDDTLLLLFLWRGRNRAVYAGVFLVVAALELYGTAIGTWRWAPALPGLGIPDGNPPSGVAAGYVWFDVMAMLVAPKLLQALVRAPARRTLQQPQPL